MTSKSSRQIFAIQFNNDDNEEDIILEEPTCLCGCMRVTRALWVVAVLRLLFDLTALYTAWDTVFMYPSVFSSLTTFTVLCVVISGLHEEKRDKIRYAHIWVTFKIIITIALTLAIVFGFVEGDFDFLKTLQFDVYTIVLMICEVALISLGVLQWYLADVTVRYIAARDDIYTIPSGKFKWRPEILSSHSIKHERF